MQIDELKAIIKQTMKEVLKEYQIETLKLYRNEIEIEMPKRRTRTFRTLKECPVCHKLVKSLGGHNRAAHLEYQKYRNSALYARSKVRNLGSNQYKIRELIQ